MKIVQFLPSFSPFDAIGNNVLEIRKYLKEAGFETQVYAIGIHPALEKEAKQYLDYKKHSSRENVIIYHHSIGSDLPGFISGLPDQLVVVYHNVTPAKYFSRYDPELQRLCKLGREQLGFLAKRAVFAVADSEYNASELRSAGFADVTVIPPLACTSLPKARARKSRVPLLLFVGRVTPHKKQDDLVSVLAEVKKEHKKARLVLAGSFDGMEGYKKDIEKRASELGVSKDVVFAGKVCDSALSRLYAQASVFVCASEHEGFCIPLVEAMRFGLPVVARDADAVGETLGGSGILVGEGISEFASAINMLLSDKKKYASVVALEKKRLEFFDSLDLKGEWARIFEKASVFSELQSPERYSLANRLKKRDKARRHSVLRIFKSVFWKIAHAAFVFSKGFKKTGYDLGKIKSVVVFKTDHLGDLVLATPVFKAIKDKIPLCKLAVVTGSWNKGVLDNNPFVDEVIFLDPPSMQRSGRHLSLLENLNALMEINKRRFDLALGLRGDHEHVELVAFSGAKFTAAPANYTLYPFLLSFPLELNEFLPEIDRHLDLAKRLGFDSIQRRTFLFLSKEDKSAASRILGAYAERNKLICVHPGGGNALGWWSIERFASVANSLASRGYDIALVGGPSEKKLGARMETAMSVKPLNIIGETSLLELAAVCSKSCLFLCNDGGPMHVASAMGTPVVAVFGPTPFNFEPFDKNKSVVVRRKVPCSPCPQFVPGDKNNCPRNLCMELVEESEVLEACERTLGLKRG